MPTAEARVPTPRAERYLAQLVDHLGQLSHGPPDTSGPTSHGQDAQPGGHGGYGDGARDRKHSHDGAADPAHGGPPEVRHIEQSGSHARIEFDWGQLLLSTTAAELIVHVQAGDAEALARGQALIARRIATIGRRDGLTVAWQPPRSD